MVIASALPHRRIPLDLRVVWDRVRGHARVAAVRIGGPTAGARIALACVCVEGDGNVGLSGGYEIERNAIGSSGARRPATEVRVQMRALREDVYRRCRDVRRAYIYVPRIGCREDLTPSDESSRSRHHPRDNPHCSTGIACRDRSTVAAGKQSTRACCASCGFRTTRVGIATCCGFGSARAYSSTRASAAPIVDVACTSRTNPSTVSSDATAATGTARTIGAATGGCG